MPAEKKAKKKNVQEEQLRLLKQILAELQSLNARLASSRASMQDTTDKSDNLNDEELEEYE